jgi:hypothetical protein
VALGIYDRAKHAVFLKLFLSTDYSCVTDSRPSFDGQGWGEDRGSARLQTHVFASILQETPESRENFLEEK